MAVAGLVLPRELETPAQLLLEDYYGGFGPRVFQPVSHRLREARTKTWNRPTAMEVDDNGNEIRSFSMYAAGTFGAGANMSFRADALREVGGFHPHLGIGTPTRGGEDLVAFVRLIWAGASTGFEPAALVHHIHRRDYESLQRQIEGYGIGYAAMFLALIAEDRRHLAAMLATVPRALTAFGEVFGDKMTSRPSIDRMARPSRNETVGVSRASLARLEIRGMVKGPFAYVRARCSMRPE